MIELTTEELKQRFSDSIFKRISETADELGLECYVVGGYVRDIFLQRPSKDIDIVVHGSGIELAETAARRLGNLRVSVFKNFGTAMFRYKGMEIEFVGARKESYRANSRKPIVEEGTIDDDQKRRDFTINAMAYNEVTGLVDAFDGMGDLQKKVIRCVGNPKERFTEDALRMLRALRFAAQLGFEVEEQTFAAIRELAQTIEKISAERIQTELVKLLTSDHPELIREVYTSGISDVILPEFSVLMQTEQNNPHHCYTVGEHTIHVVQQVENQKVLRLAALFHDIAKPVCKTTDEAGVDHFYGHPKEGAKMAHRIFRRLKFDVDTMQKVCGLVEWHDDNPNLTPAGIRKAIYRVGEERYPDLFALKRADVLSQSGYRREEKLAYIQSYQKLYEEIIEQKDCLSLKKLAVYGRDLMELGIKPGKKIGQILQKLLEEVLEEPDKNKKEYLLERVKQTYQ